MQSRTPRFVTGSIMRHILVMTGSASIGLMAMFLVDLVDIYFLSLLNDTNITAAVGFSATVLFFNISVSIGLMIAMGALVGKALGARKNPRARNTATNVMVYGIGFMSLIGIIMWPLIPNILQLLGAEGEALSAATSYLRIIIASLPVLSINMLGGGILRALGDAKRSMILTLVAAATNAILDPILIFWAGWGIEGAAIATVASRVVMLAMTLHAILVVHEMLVWPRLKNFLHHVKSISQIAIPAMLTNIATPIGAAIVIGALAEYGDGAVAGSSIIQRVSYVAFGTIFALSGAVGPIISQNLGAKQFDRITSIFKDSMKVTVIYVTAMSAVLYLAQDAIVAAFLVEGMAADLIRLFCTYLAILFIFSGAQFVANASFNNMGKAHWSTLMNFGRATLGTIPFVYYGGKIGGAPGIMVAHTLGGVIFGIVGILLAIGLVKKISATAVTARPA